MLMNLKITLLIEIVAAIVCEVKCVEMESNWTLPDTEDSTSEDEAAPSTTQGRKWYKALVDQLFKDYSPIIAPNAHDPYKPVNISMLMVIEGLRYLDMKSQTLSVTVWFDIMWTDPSFAWDTRVYTVNMIVVSEKDVWRPVLAISNTLLERDQIMKNELPVSINSNGTFHWFPGDTLDIDCQTDLRYYPFDIQTCKIQMSQWTIVNNQVNCIWTMVRSSVKGNGEWDIVDLSYEQKVLSEKDYEYWVVNYYVTLRRKWLFYLINLILPIIMVSALNNVVFLLPVDSGDKMSVSVTTFLTLMVFMTLIQDSLAKNSDTVCYLTLYIAAQMLLGALAIVQSAVVVAWHHKTIPEDHGQRKESFKKERLSCFGEVADNELKDSVFEKEEDRQEKICGQRDERCAVHVTSSSQHCNGVRNTSDRRLKECCSRYGLKRDRNPDTPVRSSADRLRLAKKIDKLCFPIFITLNLLSLLVFFLIIVTGYHQ